MSRQYPDPIGKDEARGDSPGVPLSQYRQHQERGRQYLSRKAGKGSTQGLDRNWPQIKERAYKETREPWGGGTIHAETGEFVNPSHGYALAVREPGKQPVSAPLHLNQAQFGATMDRARQTFGHELSHRDAHLGVFHDADEGRIDFDPVQIVHHKSTVADVGAYTHAAGGAYDFKTGDGVWVPHHDPDLDR